jgi:uncharacterized SAM-binding protein YcdF (DUF218 family)
VTQSWHMPRAREAFLAYGIKVIPAPTDFFKSSEKNPWVNWIPSQQGLKWMNTLCQEAVGRLYYRFFVLPT